MKFGTKGTLPGPGSKNPGKAAAARVGTKAKPFHSPKGKRANPSKTNTRTA